MVAFEDLNELKCLLSLFTGNLEPRTDATLLFSMPLLRKIFYVLLLILSTVNVYMLTRAYVPSLIPVGVSFSIIVKFGLADVYTYW